jgi:hypothetical protein
MDGSEKIDLVKQELFIDSPADLLVFKVAEAIKQVPQFCEIFGASVYPYRRMDLSVRELPALRIYTNNYTKEFESWFIDGELVLDMLMPPSIRREDLSLIPNIVSNALLQQFRRPTKMFQKVLDEVPGLNELGKRFSIQQDLVFQFEDDEAPLTQLTANFRIDLRIWDDHLEQTNRTKDDPFDVTLANLRRVVTALNGLKDDGSTGVTVSIDQRIGG